MSNITKRLSITLFTVLAAMLVLFAVSANAVSADNGLPNGYEPDIYNGIPSQQFKDVFETDTITISGITVKSDKYVSIFDENDTIHFRIFNSTTQETECEIDTVNNKDGTHTLPDMQLKKNHNYIFFVEDPWYELGTKKYVQILDAGAKMANEGPGAYDYKYIVRDAQGNEQYNKEFKKLTEINVYKRNERSDDPRKDARCCIGCTDIPVVVTYKGQPVQEKLKFRFVSDIEPFNGSTNYLTEGQGILYANLIEDVTYMVYLDSDKYAMDPFPIVVKDKSEYGEGRYAYNHTTCVRVDAEHPIKLYDSIEEAHNDPMLGDPNIEVTSLKGRVKVTGMSFRHLLILDRVLDKSLAPGMSGKDYDVIGITAVNPHRWEISKLVGTDFNITKKGVGGKLVTHVYYIKDGALKSIGFRQDSGDEVSFTMDTLSLYPVVIEYGSNKTFAQKQAEDRAAKEKKEKEAEWNGTLDRSLPVPKLSKPKAAKKSMTVKWKKLSKKQLKKAGNIKIEVQYSLDGRFPMEQTKSKPVSRKKSSVKIKSLARKKVYYVRVRTYKESGGVKKVSAWAKPKKVKIK